MLVDEVVQDFRRRSSSAWAKKALANLRISLALRSSLTSRSSAFICSRSDVVMPSRTPVSIWSRLTHSLRILGTQPILGAMDSMPVAPDLVQRRFKPEEPNQLWSGDITYIQTDEGWLYLAAVIDLFSRQVVGWSLQPHMQAGLVKDALAMAWWRRRPPPGVIFHSDRGSQYCSAEFQQALKNWGIQSSMSRKGNCWDNAPTESFWGRLKTASVHGCKFATREQASQAVMDWMAFYNHRRLHSSLGYLSPMQYEQRWYEAQRKKAA